MKAERQHKEPQQVEPIQSKGVRSKLGFIDNRSQRSNQTKLINLIQKKDNLINSIQLQIDKKNNSYTTVVQLLKDSEITTTLRGNGMSKADAKYYRSHRPPYADGQEEKVWDAAPKDELGRAICPNTGNKISWTKGTSRLGVWDMGHKTGHEYKTLWEQVATCVITGSKFIEEYQNPDNYQVEDCSANRGHGFEA